MCRAQSEVARDAGRAKQSGRFCATGTQRYTPDCEPRRCLPTGSQTLFRCRSNGVYRPTFLRVSPWLGQPSPEQPSSKTECENGNDGHGPSVI